MYFILLIVEIKNSIRIFISVLYSNTEFTKDTFIYIFEYTLKKSIQFLISIFTKIFFKLILSYILEPFRYTVPAEHMRFIIFYLFHIKNPFTVQLS